MFELDGVSQDTAREAFRLAAAKLPVQTRFVSRGGEAIARIEWPVGIHDCVRDGSHAQRDGEGAVSVCPQMLSAILGLARRNDE